MEKLINELTEKQQQNLFYYSPFNFMRDIDPENQFRSVRKKILSLGNNDTPSQFIYRATVNEIEFIFLYQYLHWDSDFFNRKCFKLFTVLYPHFDAQALTNAIAAFREHLSSNEKVYIFIDIPSEDILLIQCLGMAGFKMAETRLHFFKDNLAQYKEERYKVRKATMQDLETIMEVAGANRNEYDRVHADFEFSKILADSYLRTYAASALNGYCDTVLVPSAPGLPTDAFLALSEVKDEAILPNCKLFRVVLTAVGPGNKGWHKKLVSESIYYAKDRGASYVLMTTQSTNRAVFRSTEKLGFKLGGTSHIFSYSK